MKGCAISQGVELRVRLWRMLVTPVKSYLNAFHHTHAATTEGAGLSVGCFVSYGKIGAGY